MLHGHTYQVDVSLEGDPKEGMVIDFAEVKRAVRDVLAKYDHRDWNAFLDYPTVENICQRLHDDLRGALPFPLRVRVWEGHGKWAEL
jgi:6-pyruvoyltetrahydropterin/6-carboxytetrahydropterin synthase